MPIISIPRLNAQTFEVGVNLLNPNTDFYNIASRFGDLLFYGSSLENFYFKTRTGDQSRSPQPRHQIHLNGASQTITVPDNTDLDITDNLSVSVLFKLDNTPSTTEYLIGKYDTGLNAREWAIHIDTNNKVNVVFGGGAGAYSGGWQSTNPLTPTVINHLAFTFNGGALVVYLNGSPLSGTTSGAIPSTLYNGAGNLSIGSILNSGAGQLFTDGIIYEVRLYDTAILTSDDVTAIYNTPITASPASRLVALYKLDEGSGTVAYDSSGNENHGTYVNAPAWETSSDTHSWHNQVGYSESGAVLVPRNESNTSLDVTGASLDYSGKVAFNAKLRQSYCLYTNGTTQYGQATAVGNVNRFKGWIQFAGANQEICTLDNTIGKAIKVSGGSLTLGGDMVLISAKIGDTESAATTVDAATFGATLNAASSPQFVDIRFDDGLGGALNATDFRIGTDSSAYGELLMSGIELLNGDTSVLNVPISEGAGYVSWDVSGNGNHITWFNTPSWSLQDKYHYNIQNGFNKYMYFDSNDDNISLNISPDEIMSTGVFDISFDLWWDSQDIADYHRILWLYTTTGFARLQKSQNNSTFEFWTRKAAGQDLWRCYFTLDPDELHSCRIVGNGITVKFYVDGVLQPTIGDDTINATYFHTPTWIETTLGSTTTTLKGILTNFSLETASVTQQLQGYGNTDDDWVDVSGNGNDGTVNGSPDAILVPKVDGADADILGETLRNVSVIGHNNAETSFDFESIAVGDTIPPEFNWVASNADFTTFSFDTDWSGYDNAFYRQLSSVANDRFLVYAEDLTGSNLAKAIAYTT